MLFSSLSFLLLFLPLVFAVYFFIKPCYANAWLLIASLIFYYIGAKEYIGLLLLIISVSYISGLFMNRLNGQNKKKLLLATSLCVMIGVMCYYKYWNFLLSNINAFFKQNYVNEQILLPIGISFFTFQAISYVVDIYRGEKPLRNPIDMMLYVSFFPQLIAGPIVRFHDIRKYLDESYRNVNFANITDGFWRFCIGLSKKVLLANNLGGLADIVFNVRDVSQCSVLYIWLGAVAYTLQIYYDFSGYSDMAIGLGKIFGFEFRENFNNPYRARSVQDFWRRWHMSLSQFFRDYVYIPLGGNHCTALRWGINMMIVWTLTGFWHGASWNYILWGTIYGIVLILEKMIFKRNIKEDSSIKMVLGHVYTMLIVVVLWVIFRANNFSHIEDLLMAMTGLNACALWDDAFLYQVGNYSVILLLAIILCFPSPKIFSSNNVCVSFSKAFILIGCMIASVSYIYMCGYNPFLYFMF